MDDFLTIFQRADRWIEDRLGRAESMGTDELRRVYAFVPVLNAWGYRAEARTIEELWMNERRTAKSAVALPPLQKQEPEIRRGGIVAGRLLKISALSAADLFSLSADMYQNGMRKEARTLFSIACGRQGADGTWASEAADQWSAAAEYLKALYYKNASDMYAYGSTFLESIESDDGRYLVIKDALRGALDRSGTRIRVLDVGAGKGRYAGLLRKEFSDSVALHACDICDVNMRHPSFTGIEWANGALTCTPYEDETFDVVYTCEALEHCYHVKNSLKELLRVTKKGGSMIVIDKDVRMLGKLELADGEQWFSNDEMLRLAQELGSTLEIRENLPYEGGKTDGLFSAWVFSK